jgi:antitoxin MazE
MEAGSLVELRLVEGRLIVSPVSDSEITLESLLEGVTEQNRHGEIEYGPPVGAECW